MSPNDRGHRMVSLDHTYEVPHRVRWFLLGAYQGGSRVKRIARDLNVTLRKARRLLSGESVTVDDVSKMMRIYGPLFQHFITLPLAPGNADGFTRTAATAQAGTEALDRATRGGALSVVPPAVAAEPGGGASGKRFAGDRSLGGAGEGEGAPVKRAAE